LRVNREQAVEEISQATSNTAGRLMCQYIITGTPNEFPGLIELDTPAVIG